MTAQALAPSPAPVNLGDASPEALDDAIVALAARLNAATHDLLVLIRRFDERAGWLRWGFESCAEWLHWRCDLSMSACREKVRVAHGLKTLPEIAPAFAEGRLSYSKVRALTRVAGPANESALLEFALHTTAARVEERCRELRCGTAASTEDARQAHARRALSLRRDPARGTVTITVELPLETGELVDKALDRALEQSLDPTAESAASAEPDSAGQSWSQQRADAFVEMAMSYLNGSRHDSSGTPDHYQLVVHVDHAALTEGRGRAGLPIESVRRIACDSDRVVLIEDERGEPLRIGRKSRIVPAAIRRALWARDRGCRFPGCGRKRFVDAHHIKHWSKDGETSLENLMLLCQAHHNLCHEGGFTIEKDYQDRWFFRRPDGCAVPESGYRMADMTDDDVWAEGEYLNGDPSAEGIAAEQERSVHEDPEQYRPVRALRQDRSGHGSDLQVMPVRFEKALGQSSNSLLYNDNYLRPLRSRVRLYFSRAHRQGCCAVKSPRRLKERYPPLSNRAASAEGTIGHAVSALPKSCIRCRPTKS